MNSMNPVDEDRRRKNIRLAWILAVFVGIIMTSAIPFWQGLFRIVTSNG